MLPICAVNIRHETVAGYMLARLVAVGLVTREIEAQRMIRHNESHVDML